jgi:FKBP-type peptidyl-prolyl cis-trans isomerase
MKKSLVSLGIAIMLMAGCQNADVEAVEKKSEKKVEEAATQVVEKAPENQFLTTSKEKLSYSMGLDLGNYLKNLGDELDLEAIKLGMEDGYSGAEPKMTQDEIKAVQEEFAAKVKAKQEAELTEMKEKNSAAGKSFMDENSKKEGVVVTKSGLQYEVLEEGDGPAPVASDMVKVDYVGTLVDGTEFDSSIKRGEPAVFGVGQVVPGWSEALQLMNVGSKYRVVIPPELAYGETGAPPVIEPNSTLVFEIDLLGIETVEEAVQPEDTPEPEKAQ